MTISRTDAAQKVEQFIRQHFDVPETDPLFTRDAHLFERGFVDSIGFAELLAFIESSYGLALDSEDLFTDEFTTINGISRLIAARGASGHDRGMAASRVDALR